MAAPDYLRSSRALLEEECRRRCQAAYVGNRTVLARCLGQYPMFLDAADNTFTPCLILDGFWESWVTLAVARHVRPGCYCLDLGANHGYYTVLLAALAGPTGRVLAVEPNRRLLRLLARTRAVNGLCEQVSLAANLAWSRGGLELEFAVPPGCGLNAGVHAAEGRRTRARTVCVDDLTSGWPRVDFIKVDVEGAEIEVWEGMHQTLRRFPRATVLMEINVGRYPDRAPGFLHSIADVFPRLQHTGFNGEPWPVTMEQILADPGQGDWMLWLER